MEKLNKSYQGQIWSNGLIPNQIIFDDLTDADIPYLKHIKMDFLIIEVCDKCGKEKCICKRIEAKKLRDKAKKDKKSDDKVSEEK